MEADFRPELITKDIVYCLRDECKSSSSCLRYLAYKNSEPFSFHDFVDPRALLTENGCSHYLSNKVQRVGRGFKTAMSMVQYGKVRSLQSSLSYELDCGRSQFYRYSSGEKVLTPEQQDIVRRVFKEFGVEHKELFDSYVEAYLLPY